MEIPDSALASTPELNAQPQTASAPLPPGVVVSAVPATSADGGAVASMENTSVAEATNEVKSVTASSDSPARNSGEFSIEPNSDATSEASAKEISDSAAKATPPDVAALVAPLASALVDAVANVASAAHAANVANAAHVAKTAGAITAATSPAATVPSNVVNVAPLAPSTSAPGATPHVAAGAAGGGVNAPGGTTGGSPKAPIQVVDVYGATQALPADAAKSYASRVLVRQGRNGHAWKFPVALACILLGIMVGLQYRTQASKSDIQIDDRRKLVELVRTMESERNKMSNGLKETRTRMSELEASTGAREQVSKQLQDQLVRSRIEAGLTGMKGPGVVISMNDSPRTAPATDDNYFYIVHDVDLTALVNELWAAGAEAVCVNEQRIVTRSSIRCVGPAVLVNGVRLTAPYITKAIGSKDLETALRMPGGFLNSMAPLISKGGEVKVNSLQEVVIPPYEGTNSFRYGQSFEKSVEDEAKEAAAAAESGKSSGSLWH